MCLDLATFLSKLLQPPQIFGLAQDLVLGM